jgi:hypothetical protein
MYKLSIILLFVPSIGMTQLLSKNLVKTDSMLVDIFPLSIGNQWVYGYYWYFYGYGVGGSPFGSYTDTGTVTMQIINKRTTTDSTIWLVQEIFNIWIQNNSEAFIGPKQSIDTIEIVELNAGRHQLYIASEHHGLNSYKSVFAFPAVADTVVYRYDIVNAVGVRTFTSNEINGSDGFMFIFKKGVGLTSESVFNITHGMDYWTGNFSIRSQISTSVSNHQNEILSQNYQLCQNYPNPFNPSTTISFFVPFRSFVSLKIFDCLGREVETIAAGEFLSGSYSRNWNASNLTSGVYYYCLRAGFFADTKKLILLK